LVVLVGNFRIVSYNKRDFEGSERFAVEVETAREFLQRIGELK